MRKVLVPVVACLFALPLLAQSPHIVRFELSEEFVRSWSVAPVRTTDVRLDCPGPVHTPEKDCEIHIGAEFVDSSFTDFPKVVVEPPNLCKAPRKPTRADITELNGDECSVTGFMRAWPEHLDNGQGCSNPDHFLEIHPATAMTCGNTSFDFMPKVRAFSDLGFKDPAKVDEMMDMQYWVCRGCSPNPADLAFDFCFGDPCKAGHASNFARYNIEVIRSTIRPEEGKELDGVATVIARVKPEGSTSPRTRPLKLYAIKGTAFYDALLAERGKNGPAPKFEILGIFTLDPLSVVRALDAEDFAENEWTPVPHPVSLIVFGTL